ncbi:MAG: hypothetical protein HY696_07350 [Deltaproteobacteria bacterium]|nr:hypothetical protein [Deltaproteobacteria bacterium]
MRPTIYRIPGTTHLLLAGLLSLATSAYAGTGLPDGSIGIKKLYAITADGCIPSTDTSVETLLKMATDDKCLVKKPGGRNAVYRIYWPQGKGATFTLTAPLTIESSAHPVELVGPSTFLRTTAPYMGTTQPSVNFVVAAPFADAATCAVTTKGNVTLRNLGIRGQLPNRGLCLHGSGTAQADTLLVDGSGPDFQHAVDVTTGSAHIHNSTLAHYTDAAISTQTTIGLQLGDNRYLPANADAVPLRYQPATLATPFPAPTLTKVVSSGTYVTVTGDFTPPDDRAVWAVELVAINDQQEITPLGSESCPFEQTTKTFTCTVGAPFLTPSEGTTLKQRIAASVAYYEGGPSPFSASVEGQFVANLADTGDGPAGGIGILAGATPTPPGLEIPGSTSSPPDPTATTPTSVTDPSAAMTGAMLPLPADTAAQSATLPETAAAQPPANPVPPLVFAPAEAAQAPIEGGGGCSLLRHR